MWAADNVWLPKNLHKMPFRYVNVCIRWVIYRQQAVDISSSSQLTTETAKTRLDVLNQFWLFYGLSCIRTKVWWGESRKVSRMGDQFFHFQREKIPIHIHCNPTIQYLRYATHTSHPKKQQRAYLVAIALETCEFQYSRVSCTCLIKYIGLKISLIWQASFC